MFFGRGSVSSPPDGIRRKSSTTPHYQTFPTQPPRGKGRPPSSSPPFSARSADDSTLGGLGSGGGGGGGSSSSTPNLTSHHHHPDTPLPKRQLFVLAVIALAEQTAFNSISPYLPQMVGTFADARSAGVGFSVGIIASSFALAQLATNFFWGWLSDRIGRKPVIAMGTLLSAGCFAGFGLCTRLWQAIMVQAILGLVNGNQGVVSTCLGEITDRSNQSKAFAYLPAIYGLGAITGPAVGGLLAGVGSERFPYLTPNLFSAGILLLDFAVIITMLEESLEEAKHLPPIGTRITSLFAWVWRLASNTRLGAQSRKRSLYQQHRHLSHSGGGRNSHYQSFADGDYDSDGTVSSNSDVSSRLSLHDILPGRDTSLDTKSILENRETLILLGTYLVFQLSNVAYGALFPIFAESDPPTGRDLSPKGVGLSLSFAGVITIIFQLGIFGRIREKLGNRATYRAGLATFVVVFLLTPFVGYKDPEDGKGGKIGGIGKGSAVLWAELGVLLFFKTIASVSGLTCALLMITNTAPDHAVLGTLNGLAQTLSAAGRAAGPFLSGGLFSLATRIKKGEALAFGVFGAIAAIGFAGSFGIKSASLEAEADDTSDEDEEDGPDEESTLISRH